MAEINRAKMRVAVLAGGRSSEREISFSSGKNVVDALRTAGFGEVEMLDPASATFLSDLTGGSFDVAFIALHGEGGEDGKIQSVLDFCGIPYTGSDVTSSALAADKNLVAIAKSYVDRRLQVFGLLHIGDTVARSVNSRLHKAMVANYRQNLV